ncbi:MAG: hypothetical protein HYT79_11330 [Elusimicrobia bacterium]|nr:hypothetical protein [Elusimicrobiota bacterium]
MDTVRIVEVGGTIITAIATAYAGWAMFQSSRDSKPNIKIEANPLQVNSTGKLMQWSFVVNLTIVNLSASQNALVKVSPCLRPLNDPGGNDPMLINFNSQLPLRLPSKTTMTHSISGIFFGLGTSAHELQMDFQDQYGINWLVLTTLPAQSKHA